MSQQRMTAKQFREQSGRLRNTRPRRNLEHQHQASFFGILKANEYRYPCLAFVFAVPNGGKRTQAQGAYLVSEGLRAGCPDVVFPMPRRGYPGAFVENKTDDGKMSDAQIKFRDFLIKEGYCVKACYSVDEQIKFAEWYLGVELTK